MTTNWENRYVQYSKWVATHGKGSTEANNPSNPFLNTWLAQQRKKKKAGKLDIIEIQLLNREGIDWNYYGAPKVKRSNVMDAKVEALLVQSTKRSWIEIQDAGDDWAKMCNQVRAAKSSGNLCEKHVAKLTLDGFVWDWQTFRRLRTWDTWFERLEANTLLGNDPNLPRRGSADQTLANWVWTQRQDARKGKLSAEQITKLKNLGVWFDQRAATIEKAITSLEHHFDATGEWLIPTGSPEYQNLQVVRGAVWSKTLSTSQTARLDAMGFSVEMTHAKANLQNAINEAVEFWEEHGHCNLKSRSKGFIRSRYEAGALSDEQIAKLESIGFEWREREKRRTIHEITRELMDFRFEHGHLFVPLSAGKLGATVNNLRTKAKRGEMSEYDTALLNAIGFEWSAPRGTTMQGGFKLIQDKTFEALEDHWEEHGHCNVRATDNPNLYNTVRRIWINFKAGKVCEADVKRLAKCGFNFTSEQAHAE